MMNFQDCKNWTLGVEGGYGNHPNDSGKATNYGITQEAYDNFRIKKNLPKQDVKKISELEVKNIYYNYWIASKSNTFQSPLNLVAFDTAINFGADGFTMFLQEALNVDVDGEFGPQTEKAFKEQNQFEMALTICYGRLSYRDLRVMQKADQIVFHEGWMNRDLRLLNEIIKYDPSPSKNIQEAALRVAYLEKPPEGYKKLMEVDGTNDGPAVNRFLATAGYWPGAAWCAALVFYCIKMACYLYKIEEIPFEQKGRAGYCPYIETWARAKGILSSTPERGDAVLFPANDGVSSHIGFVTDVKGSQITTIEGNTNEAGGYEGIGIFEKTHFTSGKRFVKWWKLVNQNPDKKEESTGNLYIDNKLTDKLLIKDDVSYAPVKKFCEAIGYNVEWNPGNKSVYCSKK